jgi:hypothetical protein
MVKSLCGSSEPPQIRFPPPTSSPKLRASRFSHLTSKMAHTIVMNWNFKGDSVIESTLDTHSEAGDSVPRYRVGVVILFAWFESLTSASVGSTVHQGTEWCHHDI